MVRKFGPSEVFTVIKEEDPRNSYHSYTIVQKMIMKMKLKLPQSY
jgi:hypothetical protein